MRHWKLSRLARRYGHMSAKEFGEAVEKNPAAVATVAGGLVGLVAAGLGPGTGALLGATTGFFGSKLAGK